MEVLGSINETKGGLYYLMLSAEVFRIPYSVFRIPYSFDECCLDYTVGGMWW